MTVEADDYEIRVQQAGDVAKSYGLFDPMYVVWDLRADKKVPFGNHRREDRAVAHIERLRNRRKVSEE